MPAGENRRTYSALSTVALYLERMGTAGRVFLVLTAFWTVGLFATAILITIRIWPLWAGLAWFAGFALLGGWALWWTKAKSYERAGRQDGSGS